MVEPGQQLDSIFQALADQTRRDILKRVSTTSLSISEIAEPYEMSFAAIAKHVARLEAAGLVIKKRIGKEQHVVADPETLEMTARYLKEYETLWQRRFDALEQLLERDS